MRKQLLIAFALFSTVAVSAQNSLQATSAEARMESLKTRNASAAKSLVKSVQFRNVGPTIMSGRVVDVDVNPENPNEFFVAYATGGLWYSNNNGQSMLPVFDSVDHLFMGDIAVDWKSGTIYVGTGEKNSSRSTYAGTGVYKSTDKGKTWKYIGLPDSHHIGKVIISPNDINTVWVAVMGHLYSPNKERGVYKTTDGGNTWSKTLYVDDKTGAIDIDIDPNNSNILYAAMWYRTRSAWNFEEGGPSTGIYKSTDGGNKWTLLTTPASGFPTGAAGGRIGIAVAPQNPNMIYAVLDNNDSRPTKDDASGKYTLLDFRNITKENFAKLDDKKVDDFLRENRFPQDISAKTLKAGVADGTYKPTVVADYLKSGTSDMLVTQVKGAEVYRSSDAGKTWTKMNADFINEFSSYGYYMAKIWVSPKNVDRIVIAGVNLTMSEDGGKTYKIIGGPNVHSDHHAFWFNPNNDNHIFNGNDGGLNISYDLGKTWFLANSPSVGQFYSVTVDDARPYNVYGGLQDNGVWYGPSTYTPSSGWLANGEYPYKRLGGGDGMMVQVDTRTNNTVYFGSQFGAYSRTNKDRSQSLPIRPMHKVGENPLRFNWETPIVLSKHQQDVFYMASNKFHRSLNKGENMETLSGDLTKGFKEGDVPFGTATWLAESPLKFGLLYVGTDDGLIHISRDGGYTWTKISDKLPQDFWVSTVTPSAFKEGRVYASLNGYRTDNFTPHVYVSEDYGATWKLISGNLPLEAVNTIKEDPKNENILYVGTDQGLYTTLDRGFTYYAFSGGLPRVPVHDIAIQQRENDIVVGTHGRSIYIANLDNVQKLTPEVLRRNLELFDVRDVTLTGGGFGRFSRRPTATIGYFSKVGGATTLRIKNDKGDVLNTFTQTAEEGLNQFNYDLTVDPKMAESLKITEANDKKFYLPAGTYQVEIESSLDKSTKKLVLRSAATGGGPR